jgi:hypothetical protein
MDLLISSGVFALILAILLVLMTGRQDDGNRAKALLEQVTRSEVNDAATQLIRTDARHRAKACF